MTTITTSSAGSTALNPTTLPVNLGPVIADVPETVGSSDSFTAMPTPIVPTSTPTASAPTTTDAAAGTTTAPRSGIKWTDTDKTLPIFKRILQFVRGNIACLNPKV